MVKVLSFEFIFLTYYVELQHYFFNNSINILYSLGYEHSAIYIGIRFDF